MILLGILKNIIEGAVFQKHYTSAVILAAGIGSRFGNENGTKQNVSVGGVPAVVRTVLAFENCDKIDEIVLTVRKEETELMKSYVKRYSLKKVSAVVEGGETRAASSALGVAAVNGKCRFVAVHDGARCLVTPKIIEDTVTAAYRYGAAAAAERVVDTVKIADSKGFIKSTVDRDTVWLVKTPQVFKHSMYVTSSAMAEKDGVTVTDDCMMAERLGFSIKLVDCGKENIKLTSRDDLSLAEYIISKRKS